MKILVTGATGFIGSTLCSTLEAADYDVIAVGNEVDLRDLRLTEAIFVAVQPDVVFHLAANVGVKLWEACGSSLLIDNITIDCNVARAISRLPQKPRIFYASSSEVYQDEDQNEDTPLNLSLNGSAREGYALGKIIGEKMFNDVNIRFFNIVGAHQDSAFALPRIVTAALQNDTIKASKDYRSFCAVEDACIWLVRMLQQNADPGVYNIGNPDNFIRMDELAEKVRVLTGSSSEIEVYQDGYCKSRRPDISKALRFYQPKYNLDYIIKKIQASIEPTI